MSRSMNDILPAKLLVYSNQVKELVTQIKKIENDLQMPPKEKLSQIKIIRAELNKVGTEIDKVKKEIKLLSSYSVN